MIPAMSNRDIENFYNTWFGAVEDACDDIEACMRMAYMAGFKKALFPVCEHGYVIQNNQCHHDEAAKPCPLDGHPYGFCAHCFEMCPIPKGSVL